MYYFLTAALKERILTELRFFWARHPRYRSTDGTLDLVNHIQGKYRFDERPQRSIILKTSSANHVTMAPDNFIGHLESHVMLAKIPGKDGFTVEWVKENERLVRKGSFPSPPGIYYLEVVESDDETGTGGKAIIDPMLTRDGEAVSMDSPTTGQLQGPFIPRTLNLYEMPGDIPLSEPLHYTADPSTGAITLNNPLSPNRSLSADYKYEGPRIGPFSFGSNTGEVQAIPGVVIAFGRRYRLGDQVAIVVTPERCLTDRVFGGRWDITLDFEVQARDVHDQEEIADATVMYLQGIARSRLSSDGIEIGQVTMGGETEEIYNDTEDTYYYGATFSATFQTDWEIREPLPRTIRHIFPLTPEEAKAIGGMTDEEVAAVSSTLQLLDANDLIGVADPYFSNQTNGMEMIRP